jgi:hypothetical protein
MLQGCEQMMNAALTCQQVFDSIGYKPSHPNKKPLPANPLLLLALHRNFHRHSVLMLDLL